MSLHSSTHQHQSSFVFLLLLIIFTTTTITFANSQQPKSNYQPREFHLAFTNGKANELVVSFHTSNYNENILGKPIVKFGLNENLENYEIASYGNVVTSYGDSSKTGFDFHILLIDLKYSTKYYYQCGFEKSEIVSETFFFYTRSDPKSEESKETTIVIYGDQGTTNSKYVIAQTQAFVTNFLQKSSNKNLFIYHLGDISYADDFSGAMYQPIWTKYMQMMSRIMPYVPYMVCVGNHENGPQNKPYDEFEDGFQAYNHRFFMPSRNDSSIGHNMWYTFKQGLITFVSTDTETNFPQSFFPQYDNLFNRTKDQLVWLEETLKTVDRKETPFLIVVGHRPIYSSDYAFSDIPGNIIGESLRLQSAFEDLLYKYHVDIAFYGHVHSYERTHPVYKTKVESNTNMHNLRYPIHIVNGAGGNIEGLTASKDYHFGHSWTASIFNQDEGYGILKTFSSSKVNSLTFNFYAATSGKQVDSFTITKDAVTLNQ